MISARGSLFEIKQYISSSLDEYRANLKDQIKLPKIKILFLREELRENNVSAKYEYKASTADETELHKINK